MMPTQGKYATWDSNGMCYLMPWRHLPEWRWEDEWALWQLNTKQRLRQHCASPLSIAFTRSHYEVTEDTFESSVQTQI